MSSQAPDHRRATAQRNLEAILDATSRLLGSGKAASVSAVAAASGLSRPTVYAHFPDRERLLEAVVERAVRSAHGAILATQPHRGDAMHALGRITRAAWEHLHHHAAIARAAADELPASTRRRLHVQALAPLDELIGRGRSEGTFRTDVPQSWLVSVFYALLHATADEMLADHATRDQAADMLATTLQDVFAPR